MLFPLRQLKQLFPPYVDLPIKKPTIILAGSGRSGSTWLQNNIENACRYRVLFEPFCPDRCLQGSGWLTRQYLEPKSDSPKLLEVAERVIRGRVRCRWVDQDNKVFFVRGRLIKDIRVNLCLAWIKENFPEVRIVYLLRHPFKVAQSRMRLGWGADLGLFLCQQKLMDEFFSSDLHVIKSTKSDFAKQVLFWIMENRVPLMQLTSADAFAVSYEDLVANPKDEMQRVFGFLGLQMPSNFQHVLCERSRTSAESHTAMHVSEQDIEEASILLNHFGFEALYKSDSFTAPELRKRDIFKCFQMARR